MRRADQQVLIPLTVIVLVSGLPVSGPIAGLEAL
jgi:hypothetical protein